MPINLAETRDLGKVDDYIQSDNGSNLYHDYRWGKVIEKCFGHKYYLLLANRQDGTITGVLPFVHMKSWSFGNFIVSMPYLNYGGVCAEDESTRTDLLEEAIRIAKDLHASHFEFRQENLLNNHFPVKTAKVSMRLGLPGSHEDLWKSLPSKLRSQVKVPQKAGMISRIGRVEELESFYHVFSVNMRHLGTPVYPKRFFRTILEQFPKTTWICSVYAGETPVASGFLAGYKNRLEIPWASSLRKFNRSSPNMLLYWSCLKFACETGFNVFDFGRSTPGESTYRFKEQWGALPTPMPWSYWIRNEETIPDITPKNQKYHFAIEVWKKLPLPVTKILGPRIIRNIP
jgi:serine/alanine adding enzyme